MSTVEGVLASLVGAWRLIIWEEIRSDGSVHYPLGPEAIGQLVYDASGHVSAQLVRPGGERFGSDDWQSATSDERATAWRDYFGYFGTFRINEVEHAVVHEIEGSWFPNLAGVEQVRRYQLDGNRLNLHGDTARGQIRIVWERFESRE